jgi:hypothetical protein
MSKEVAKLLSKASELQRFRFWIVGDTPLITHAWSHKAKAEMLAKQVKATRGGRDAKNPDEDFVSSLYEFKDGAYGFPVTAIKNSVVSAAHKDKGIAKTAVQSAVFFEAEMVRTRPALAAAICDMPLVRIWGDAPVMREDMVRVGTGLNKVASLAYRAQFTRWAIRVAGRINISMMPLETLAFLINEGGTSYGLGEWRNEKKGIFGSFHLANEAEEAAWEALANGKGPIPTPVNYLEAAE